MAAAKPCDQPILEPPTWFESESRSYPGPAPGWKVDPPRVVGAAAHNNDQSSVHQRLKTSPRSSRRPTHPPRDLGGGQTVTSAKSFQDDLVHLIHARRGLACAEQGNSEVSGDLLQRRRSEPRLLAGRGHTLDAAAPLLDETQLVEDAPDHPVPQLGDAATNLLDGQPEREQAR